MPVSDFECQIARGQIGRYLGGGALSPEAMAGLEEHLGECPGCKALVAERRAALMGALGGEVPTRAVVSMPVENPLIAALRAKGESDAPKETTAPKAAATPRYAKPKTSSPFFGKPIALAAVLAGVLVGMSYVSRLTRGQGAPGAKAASGFAAAALPEATVIPKPIVPASVAPKPTVVESKTVVSKPIAPQTSFAKPVTKPAMKPLAVKATVKPAPKPLAPKVAAKPAPKKLPIPHAAKSILRKPTLVRAAKPVLVRRRPFRRSARKSRVRHRRVVSTSVRVYGLDGHPLKP